MREKTTISGVQTLGEPEFFIYFYLFWTRARRFDTYIIIMVRMLWV